MCARFSTPTICTAIRRSPRARSGSLNKVSVTDKGSGTLSGDPIRYARTSAVGDLIRYGRSIMDKSSKAVDAALRTLREVEAALAASKRWSNERAALVFAVMDAERAYYAALRAEKTPRVNCACCQRRFKPDEPMVWQWRYGQSAQVCLRCDRSEHRDEHTRHADRLLELDQQPCETCARTMYFDGFHRFHARRPQTCSYQCGYRRKLKRQLERKRVEHATVACVVCGEMFTQRRRDAQTCGNRCRQALHRQRSPDFFPTGPKAVHHNEGKAREIK
jgi:hypothetical protein